MKAPLQGLAPSPTQDPHAHSATITYKDPGARSCNKGAWSTRGGLIQHFSTNSCLYIPNAKKSFKTQKLKKV